MTAKQILAELETLGSASTKNTLMRHGARDPFFGVKVADLKVIQKRIKTDHALALELYGTGNSDAMYLAGLIADDDAMSKADLRRWVRGAYWYMLSEYTVPWVAAGSRYGWELALDWIESDRANVAATGWATIASLVSIRPDSALDLPALKQMLTRVQKSIHQQPNRVRYTMNGFVISLAAHVLPLSEAALAAAKKIGTVSVEMGATECKVPFAPDYIEKIRARGTIGKKRRTAKC